MLTQRSPTLCVQYGYNGFATYSNLHYITVVMCSASSQEDIPRDLYSGTRIAIVDNDRRAADSIVAFLAEHFPPSRLIWCCASGYEAILRCEESETKPDLLLLDMSLEGLQGTETCQRIRMSNCDIRILAMTSFSLNHYRNAAIRAGAQGIADKSNDDDLTASIQTIMGNRSAPGFDDPKTAYIRLNRAGTRDNLSPREHEIINLCATEGLLDNEIASRLGISTATVRKHLQHVLAKIGAQTSRQAVSLWLTKHNE